MGYIVEHVPQGDPCRRCGLPPRVHRPRRERASYKRAWNAANPRPNPAERIIGIDGEGIGRAPHLYNYLAAADEHGYVWDVGDNPSKQLSTEECFEFALELPTRALVFAFAFLYDLTKWCTDLDDRSLYLLFHPAKRSFISNGQQFYRPVPWPHAQRGPYFLNYINRKFTVRRENRRAAIWDIFAFYQAKFTSALKAWKIGGPNGWNWDDRFAANWEQSSERNVPPAIRNMERMKEKRSIFDRQGFDEIRLYCQEEVKDLAMLGRSLITAHETAGFPLKRYDGAGSTASALMNKHNVKNFIGTIPDAMKEGVACAFFGGRFENSVIGSVNRPVWNADISSAYPYAATFLPCLIHGSWKHYKGGKTDGPLENADELLTLVKWNLPQIANDGIAWGPLPIRKADGSIAFPLAARLGWTWGREFVAARELRANILALEVWQYSTECQCQPFSFLPAVYLERLRIGKDGAGIVLKLGPNSVYGKLVQSVGYNPPFQCWVWGGNITSTCRAQLLEALALAPNLGCVLMLATDGVWSDCELALPKPRDTGTSHVAKPLGGWEIKEYPRGVFAARPGIYFPLDPTEEDLQKVRARGLGRRVLYDTHAEVIAAYERGDEKVTVPGGQRFIGAKTGMSWSPKQGVKRSPNYGEWIDWSIDVTFDPKPKRERILSGGRLKCWDYFDAPSLPYDKAYKSTEDELLQLASLIAEEQPTGEFTEEDLQ